MEDAIRRLVWWGFPVIQTALKMGKRVGLEVGLRELAGMDEERK